MTTTPKKQLYDLPEITRALHAIFQPDDVIEVRCLNLTNRPNAITAGYFNDHDKAAKAIASMSGKCQGVYVVLSKIAPDLLARSANVLKSAGGKDLTSDSHIIERRWLPLDFDPKRLAGISSTNPEHELALSVAAEARDYLINTLNFPADSMIMADSGNGAHLLIRINGVSLDKEGDKLIEDCLKGMGAIFSTKEVEVDLKVFNRARIWKAYGSLAAKGSDMPDRPWRIARTLLLPDKITPTPIELLKKLAELAPDEHKSKQSQSTEDHRRHGEKIDLAKWLPEHDISVKSIGNWQGWTKYIPECCPFDSNHSGSSVSFLQNAEGAIKFRCEHSGCNGKTWKDVRLLKDSGYDPNKQHTQQYHPPLSDDGHEPQPQHTGKPILNDTTNAEYLIKLYGNILRFDHLRQRWLIWNGHRWKTDSDGDVYRKAIAAMKDRYAQAGSIDDLEELKRLANWAIGSQNRSRLEAMISLARNSKPIANDGKNWDNDPWLLGVENGVVNLKTGKLRDGNPADNITMSTGINYDPNAKCPVWLNMLNGIFEEDHNLIDWLHRRLGYSITGITNEQDIITGYGSGANGKGKIAQGIRHALGDYAYDAPFSTFERNFRASIPNDIAALEHRRIVTSSETNDDTRLNEARIKALSHGDPMTARYLHAEFFTFEPVCHIWLFVNHKPKVLDDSFGFWRGVRLLPFNRRFEGDSDDKHLGEKLETELSGILTWLVAGCLEWQKRGLSEIPEKITTATQQYKKESNILADFFDECTVEDSKLAVLSSTLYKVYCWYAEKSNYKKSETLSAIKFSKVVASKYPKIHGKTGNYFIGMGFVTDLVTGFECETHFSNVFLNVESLREEKCKNPSLPVKPVTVNLKQPKFSVTDLKNPSQPLIDKFATVKRYESSSEICVGCGNSEMAMIPDGSGYFCSICHGELIDDGDPNF